MKFKPSLSILVEDYGRKIEFKNFFSFAQWVPIRKDLKTLLRKMRKSTGEAEIAKIFSAYSIDEQKLPKNWLTVPRAKAYRAILEQYLDNECVYYFYCKCEYEVVVTGWPNEKINRKIDVYKQLRANWNIFVDLVMLDLGLPESVDDKIKTVMHLE